MTFFWSFSKSSFGEHSQKMSVCEDWFGVLGSIKNVCGRKDTKIGKFSLTLSIDFQDDFFFVYNLCSCGSTRNTPSTLLNSGDPFIIGIIIHSLFFSHSQSSVIHIQFQLTHSRFHKYIYEQRNEVVMKRVDR